MGVAVQSRFLAVGALVPWVKAGVGAVATQGKTNANFGLEAFDLIEKGMEVDNIVNTIIKNDKNPEARQLGIINAQGKGSAYTGSKCLGWAGHKVGKSYCCQGNVLLGKVVLDKIVEAYNTTRGDLADRLLAALQEGQEAGGDRRGKQSAALLVKKEGKGFFGGTSSYIDLRVDEHLAPISELERLLECHRILYAMNHKDKYFKFKKEIRHKLVLILQDIGFLDNYLPDGKKLEDLIIEYGVKNGFDRNEILHHGLINGEVVFSMVNELYNNEYDRLSTKVERQDGII